MDLVSDPLGRVTTATYDPAGRQLSQADPDGNTTTWSFDAAGREKTTSSNGKLLASVDRDRQNRRVVITDHTGADGLTVEHELGFNRRGQLTSRTAAGRACPGPTTSAATAPASPTPPEPPPPTPATPSGG